MLIVLLFPFVASLSDPKSVAGDPKSVAGASRPQKHVDPHFYLFFVVFLFLEQVSGPPDLKSVAGASRPQKPVDHHFLFPLKSQIGGWSL